MLIQGGNGLLDSREYKKEKLSGKNIKFEV